MQYQNISGNDLILTGHGVIKDGETVDLEEGFYNPNFKIVNAPPPPAPPVAQAQVPEPPKPAQPNQPQS